MRLIAWMLLGAALSGCVSMNHKPVFPDASPQQLAAWQQHQQNLDSKKDNWRLLGRFGVSMEGDAWSGSIWWQQQHDDYEILLSGPLQQGTIKLSGNAHEAKLQIAEERTFTDGDAESLLSKYAGWPIPFASLRYWVLGLPQPIGRKQIIMLDEQGRIKQIENTYWNVIYRGYREFEGVTLPRKIILEHSDAKIRLVFDQWTFND